MSLRKLVDNGIGVEFVKYGLLYKVAKDLDLETYFIISNDGEAYKNERLWSYEVEDTEYWEEIESFIENLVEGVEDENLE